MPVAEIITIGTELLLGETVDTNTRLIARALRDLGVDLYRTLTVGDNAERISEAVRQAINRAEIVLTTGGLGPTVDDPTRQAIAHAAGTELEFHPELWDQIVRRISRYGRTAGENQRRQAYIPRGARVIENPVGTAPAFIVETSRGVVICLPGVPREMETLLTQAVVPFLKQRFDLHEVIKVRSLHAAGIGEGSLDELIGDLETLANPTVGLTAHSGVVDVRIAAKAATEAQADQLISGVEKDVRARLGANIFGSDDENLEGVTLQAVAGRGWTLAAFESGMDGALLTRLSRSGHPAYRNGSSHPVAPAELAAAAEAIRQESAASISIGVNLVAAAEQQEIYLVLVTPRGREERTLTYGGHPRNAPRWAANMALDWLRRFALEIN
jgi:nicotinamide-nucleotide amidase